MATASLQGGVGRKPEAKLCTEEHESHVRHVRWGKPARDAKPVPSTNGRMMAWPRLGELHRNWGTAAIGKCTTGAMTSTNE